jgi:hypothetical protein|tara:strand:- start:637 stop:795 length:159 start_codon:yes stop_codon:yes gene_type:complete
VANEWPTGQGGDGDRNLTYLLDLFVRVEVEAAQMVDLSVQPPLHADLLSLEA